MRVGFDEATSRAPSPHPSPHRGEGEKPATAPAPLYPSPLPRGGEPACLADAPTASAALANARSRMRRAGLLCERRTRELSNGTSAKRLAGEEGLSSFK